MRSKDPNTQVGACVVDENNRIISTGYNGLPLHLKDEDYPWNSRDINDPFNSKYTYVIHAEANAILFAKRNLSNAKLYSSLFPCSSCAKLIIQSEIREVIYTSDKYDGSADNLAAKRMFKDAHIKCRQVKSLKLQISV